MQHWSLDVQHQLTRDTFVSIGYYGSKGTHLIGSFELNALPPGYAIDLGPTGCATGNSTTPTTWCQVEGTAFTSSAATNILDQIRPYQGYRSLNIIQPRFNSNYHSLQVAGRHQFNTDSYFDLAYTWGRNMTDSLSDRSHAPQNSYDIASEYGRANFDRRHILTMNYVYELPWYQEQRGFSGKLLGGWQMYGIITFQTGLPFTATTSAFDAAGLGIIPALIAGNRPNQLCDPNEGGAGTFEEWFNTDCFEKNPSVNTGIANVVGSAGRSTIDGPGTRRVDFTLAKNIRFGEHMRLQLRAETFNVFNWTNFRAIQTNVTNAAFGQVISVRDPRTMQFGIKFYW